MPRAPRWSRFASSAAGGAWACSTSARAATTARCTVGLTARRPVATPRSARPSESTSRTRTCARVSASGSATTGLAYRIMVPQKLPRTRVCSSTRPARRWAATAIATEETTMQVREVPSVCCSRSPVLRSNQPCLHHRHWWYPPCHRPRWIPSDPRRRWCPPAPYDQRAPRCAARSAAGAHGSCDSVHCAGAAHRAGRSADATRSAGGER